MADYAKLLRSGVATIKKTTESLQPIVLLNQWTGQDVYGKATFSHGEGRVGSPYKVILNQQPMLHKDSAGQVVAVAAYAAFLEPVVPNNALNRINPIDPRDIITLPDGTTGPIIEVKGFIDAGTDKPMFSEVWIGAAGAGTLSE